MLQTRRRSSHWDTFGRCEWPASSLVRALFAHPLLPLLDHGLHLGPFFRPGVLDLPRDAAHVTVFD